MSVGRRAARATSDDTIAHLPRIDDRRRLSLLSVVVFLRDSAFIVLISRACEGMASRVVLSIGFLRKPTKNTHVARVPQNKIK